MLITNARITRESAIIEAAQILSAPGTAINPTTNVVAPRGKGVPEDYGNISVALTGSFPVVALASTVLLDTVAFASTVRVGVLHDTLAALENMPANRGGE